MIEPALDPTLPPVNESVAYARSLEKPSVAEILAESRESGTVLLQPRCGVGGHSEMTALLRQLELAGAPDILSVTIDSHTRLQHFDVARAVLLRNPQDLNGYPLVSHGWKRGRELNTATAVPLEVRHGSPVAERLFDTTIASGITSFEGGGISYNIPYAKDVPLATSLNSWRRIDERCGELADLGLVVDRELFGTLTAVLVPPSISLAVSILEAVSAARAGVQCISVAYPQGGNAVQDVAALRAISVLGTKYLSGVTVHPVLHQFMGQFPRLRRNAVEIILEGAAVGKLGGARKIVVKSVDEAHGRPSVPALAEGLRIARRGFEDQVRPEVLESDVEAELHCIVAEVGELVDDLLGEPTLIPAISAAFRDGRLDVPFSPSTSCRDKVLPARDRSGAIRIHDFGSLPVSAATRQRHADALRSDHGLDSVGARVDRDIHYLLERFGEPRETTSVVSFADESTQRRRRR